MLSLSRYHVILSSDGRMDETASCFHGWWSEWCNVLSSCNESARCMELFPGTCQESQWACWELKPCSKVTVAVEPVPSVWAMCRQKDLVTDPVTKYKACTKFYGSNQELGLNCFEIFFLVTTWMVICFFLFMPLSIIGSWGKWTL